MIDLKKKDVSFQITVIGSMSSAEIVAADINYGCPAIVHVIDAVLLPQLEAPAAAHLPPHAALPPRRRQGPPPAPRPPPVPSPWLRPRHPRGSWQPVTA